MIRFENLILRRGANVLIERTNLTLQPGEKIGLVGANGAGKTSLFALLLGTLHADAGDYYIPPTWRIAHVDQETPASERSALDHVIDGDTALRAVEQAIAALEQIEHGSEADEGGGEKLAHLHAAYADLGGYTVVSRAETLLLGLGFTLAETRQPVASFSGGWRMRLNLARALMCPSELLLLDEPTNHLDLDAIVWLEQWLRRYAGTLLVISHDREFLDSVCSVILHIDQLNLKRYTGNYTSFETQRAMQLNLSAAAYARQQREITHLHSFIDRFKAKASKARQAQSRVKALERMELLAPVRAASPFTFAFRTPLASPDPLIVADRLQCGYRSLDKDSGTAQDAIVLDGVQLTLRPGERIGLLGANGQGKSTFIKTLAGTLPPLGGVLQAGKGLAIGYFAQHQIDVLRLDETPLQQLARIAPQTREQELRNYLGSFDFGNDMATAPIAPLSGGEKARLALALIIWTRPNLLLLDEPTNHLDLDTREALTLALAQFEGTLVLVAHDRALLRATTDNFLLVADGVVRPFDGDLDDYRAWLLGRGMPGTTSTPSAPEVAKPVRTSTPTRSARTPVATATPIATAATVASPGVRDEDRKLQRKREAESRNQRTQQRRPLETRIKRIDEQLARLAERRGLIEGQLADSTTYAAENKERLRELLGDQAFLAREVGELEAEWLELHETLERLDADESNPANA